MTDVYITDVGRMRDDDAFKKLSEYEHQIAGFESTICNHENAIIECKRQIEAIRKLAEPIRKALIKRLGGG